MRFQILNVQKAKENTFVSRRWTFSRTFFDGRICLYWFLVVHTFFHPPAFSQQTVYVEDFIFFLYWFFQRLAKWVGKYCDHEKIRSENFRSGFRKAYTHPMFFKFNKNINIRFMIQLFK